MAAQDHENISCTVEGDLALLKRYQNGDQEALEELLSSHLALIDFWAGKAGRRIRWLTREDRRNQGCVGFIEAAQEFDVEQDKNFDVKARDAIKKAFRREKILPIPRHSYRNARRVLEAQQDLFVKLDRRPTNEELATKAQLSVKQVKNAFEVIAAFPLVLETDRESERVEVEDLFEFQNPYDEQLIRDLLKRLNRKDVIVIYRFYFFGQSEQEIAIELGRSEGAIATSLYRARQRLRAILSEDPPKKDGIRRY